MTNLFSYFRHIALAGFLAWTAMFPTRSATVDDFQQNQATITGAGSSTQDGAMLGGERDLQVTVTAGTVTAGASLGVLKVTGSAGASGTVVSTWDGNDNNATTLANTGLAAQNLTSGGDNAFLIGINRLVGSPTITIIVHSGVNSSSFAFTVPPVTPSEFPQLLRVQYTAFSVATGTGANFASVGAIQLQVSGLSGATVDVDSLRTGSSAIPVVEALLTDVVLVDNDSNGKASPGDTLRYVVTIKNNDATAKTGVAYSANIPANTTGPANLTATPLARDDAPISTSVPGNAFHTAFNTTLTIPDGDADEDLLINDFLGLPVSDITKFGGGTLGGTVDSNDDGATVNSGGHSLTVNANGSFTYTPASGFAGLFTFQYRLGTGAASDTATVTIAVGTRPNATDDTYEALGNVQITHAANNGVIQKATADSGDAITVTSFGPNLAGVGNHTAGTAGLTANNGNLTLNADGSFTYNPPPGFTGTGAGADSFVYRINNGFNQPDTATVTINITSMIWFINNAAAGGGDGRLSTPFNTIAAYTASAPTKDAGDIIFIYQGAGNYSGGLSLVNNQQLIGQGVDLVGVTGIVAPPGSASLPGLAGNPVLANAGTIVTLPGTSGASTIRGLTLNPSSGSAIAGAGSGTTTVANNSINPSGTANGIFLATQNGPFTLTASPITANSSGAALFVSAGSGNVTIGSTITQTGSGRVVDIQNRTGGTVAISANVVANTGTGINIVNNASGSPAINFTGSSIVLNTGANPALTITGNTGATITFQNGGLDIDTTSGMGLNATGNSTINIPSPGNSINSTTATAISANGVTFNATFDSVSSGGANNISLTTVSGTLTMNGGSLTGSTAGNNAFIVSGGSAIVTYSGSITKNTTGALLNVTGGHTGTLTFNTGTLSATTASAGTGLQFDNADGTYNFNGTTTLNGGDAGVDILNGSAGTFTFVANTTITSPTGTAFNVNGSPCNVTYSGNITQANNAAMVSVTGHASGTITFQTGTLSASNGTGLQFDNADSTTSYNFNGTTTLNGGDAGVDILNGSIGTFTFGTGTTITHNAGIGTAFNINASNCGVTYNGSITDSNGRAVDIDNHDSGTVTFQTGSITSSGASAQGIRVVNSNGGVVNFNGQVTLSTAGANAVDMNTGNGGGTVNFNAAGNGLDITTTTGTGILASGGTTITVTAAGSGVNGGNTITSTGGTALSVVNATIGAGGLTFQSISANGGTKAIVLNTTGSSGGLNVTGSGTTDGSGGLIQNISQRGIELISVAATVSLKNMTLNNANTTDSATALVDLSSAANLINIEAANGAITVNGVSTLTLDNVDINGAAQMGICGRDLVNFSLLNSTITQVGDGIYGGGGAHNESSVLIYNLGSSSAVSPGTATINNSDLSFTQVRTFGIVSHDKFLNVTVSNSTFRDTQRVSAGGAINTDGEEGFFLQSFSDTGVVPVVNVDLINSSFLRNRTQGIQIFATDDTIMSVDITGCTIDCQAGGGPAGLDDQHRHRYRPEYGRHGPDELQHHQQSDHSIAWGVGSEYHRFHQFAHRGTGQ